MRWYKMTGPSTPRFSRAWKWCVIATLMTTQSSPAQITTNDWQPTGANANGYWTNATNWLPGVPNSATDVARFGTDYTANFNITQDVSQTIHGLIYNDPAASDTSILSIRPIGAVTLTFDGSNPFIHNTSDYTAQLRIYSLVDFGSAGLTVTNTGNVALFSFMGSGTLTAAGGTLELGGNNTNFTGEIVANNATVDLRGGTANTLGTTNAGTILNGSSVLRLRDLTGITVYEPVTINGFNARGSIKGYASTNVTFNGPVTLNTNGVLTVQQWFASPEPGQKRDWFVNSVISDDGNARGVHFLNDVGDSAGTGSISRTSEIIFGGVGNYGGYTHVTANRAPDGSGPFVGTLHLTNGDNRLPIGTTLMLGGALNGVGNNLGNGELILGGNDQELAGLTALGGGTENRVTGGSTDLSTLTLNIGAGRTNIFTGSLGGSGLNENNLALVAKGPGILELAGPNTYAGNTTVTNGTLRVNGSHIGGAAYAVLDGGTLGGTGFISAQVDVLAGGFAAPGVALGKLTTSNSFNLAGTLQIELANAPGAGAGLSDMLDVNGFFDITNGTIQFIYSETPTNAAYVFAEYDSLSADAFASVVNLPDGYYIAYNYLGGNQIALVIPEPSTFALLGMGIALLAGAARRRSRRASS